MHANRNSEVHGGGPKLTIEEKTIRIPVAGTYEDKSGTMTMMGSPGPLIGADISGSISMPEYFFTIGG
jgi:hypothetical protein